MNSTDVLLKRKEEPGAEARRLQALEDKERERELNRMAAEVNVLQAFKQSDAWTLLSRQFEDERKAVLAVMADCDDPTRLAKCAGALVLLEGYQRWPTDKVAELLQSIEETKQD